MVVYDGASSKRRQESAISVGKPPAPVNTKSTQEATDVSRRVRTKGKRDEAEEPHASSVGDDESLHAEDEMMSEPWCKAEELALLCIWLVH